MPLVQRATFPEYIYVIAGVLVFIFFGLSKETLGLYAEAYQWTTSLCRGRGKFAQTSGKLAPVEVQLQSAHFTQ